MRIQRVLAGVLAVTLPCFSPAQQDTQKEIERYRQMLQESNPAELFEARGEELWKTRRGAISGSDLVSSKAPTCGFRATLRTPTACRTPNRVWSPAW
jgi:hypothetical protein